MTDREQLVKGVDALMAQLQADLERQVNEASGGGPNLLAWDAAQIHAEHAALIDRFLARLAGRLFERVRQEYGEEGAELVRQHVESIRAAVQTFGQAPPAPAGEAPDDG